MYVRHFCTMHYTIQLHTHKTGNGIKLHRNLCITDTLGHLSNEDTLPSQPHKAGYKSTSELGAPFIQDGVPLVSSIERFHCISMYCETKWRPINLGIPPMSCQARCHL